jgi:hypothetical protein
MKNHSLIYTLIINAKISREQAIHALTIVSEFAKEKFPVLRGNISSILKNEIEKTKTSELKT